MTSSYEETNSGDVGNFSHVGMDRVGEETPLLNVRRRDESLKTFQQ